MGKLGYTWYPNDWRTDDKVFNLSLEMRGFYREFIDFAYQNDNNFAKNHKYWCRMLDINKRKFDKLFDRLLVDNFIKKKGDLYFIPSVEPRIQQIRGGRLGGQKSKPTSKLNDKVIPKLSINQKEGELKREDKGNKLIPSYKDFKEYAFTQNLNTDFTQLKLKYQSWLENDWKDGNERPIKNWKSKLLNTLQYLKKHESLLKDRL